MGVRSEHVREVTRMGLVTPLPRAPAFVLGVVGQRGEVFPVIDLLRFLGQGDSRPKPGARLFVAAVSGSVVAFVVEQVEGLRRIAEADRLPPPSGPGPGLEHVEGVSQPKLAGPLTLLDLPGIVAAARRALVSR
jgi:purine-binding chemotaxis protein CheW